MGGGKKKGKGRHAIETRRIVHRVSTRRHKYECFGVLDVKRGMAGSPNIHLPAYLHQTCCRFFLLNVFRDCFGSVFLKKYASYFLIAFCL